MSLNNGFTAKSMVADPAPIAPSISPPEARFPFMKLFAAYATDASRSEEALEKIRKLIYSFVWVRNLKHQGQGDFIIDTLGITRNADLGHALSSPPRRKSYVPLDDCDSSLVMANKIISEDFVSYLYGVNTVEIQADLQLNCRPGRDTATCLDLQLGSYACRNFKKYSKRVTIVMTYPELEIMKYYREDCKWIAKSAGQVLENHMEGWGLGSKGGNLRIIVEFSSGAKNLKALVVAALPFYPLNFTNWTLCGRIGKRTWRVSQKWLNACDRAWHKE